MATLNKVMLIGRLTANPEEPRTLPNSGSRVIKFRFGNGGFDMKVRALEPGKHVLWEVIDGPPEWFGTKVSFDIRQEDDWTIIFFKHAGWKEPIEFMHHCSTKWGVFLLSLKSMLETGKGAPWPNEIKLDSWEEDRAAA